MKTIFILFFTIYFFQNSFAQDSAAALPTKISGTVTGEKDKLLNGANIVIEGTVDGATTDEKGYYEFETEESGQKNLIVTFAEYKAKTIPIDIVPGNNLEMNVTMSKEEVRTEEIIVTASSFTSGNNVAVTLTPLEIVRIPGADADIYRAITTFPGSNQVNEGSRIAVRGGDPDEVLTIMDLASLYNPFLFDETFNVSSYSTINPWGLKGINFTSGGFSSKYGNVLSALLDLKSYDIPQGSGMFAWIGLANASLDGVYLSKDRNFGATVSLGKLFLEPYFAINGKNSDYAPIPQSNQLGGTLSYMLSKTENIKVYANYSDDRVGIFNPSASYDGYYNGRTKNFFSNIKTMLAPSTSTVVNAGISFSLNERNTEYGNLNTDNKEIYSKGRVDFTKQINNKIDLNSGIEYEYNNYKITGAVPFYTYNLQPGADVINVDTTESSGRAGMYVESQIRVGERLFFIPGVRSDYQTLSDEISFDPRMSMGYQISKYGTMRGAVGIYHQYPYIDNYFRALNNSLKPQEAVHYILGYEYNKDGNFIARVEGYLKDYYNLVLFNPDNFYYGSDGEGFAKGIDVFLKTKIKNKFTGWISYSYCNSKRKQYDATELVPAKFDITNSLNVVGSYSVNDAIVVGLSYKINTGKPYTPVVSAEYDSEQQVYIPSYGQQNSARYPEYNRLDMNAQYIFSLFRRFAVAVLAVNNILNQQNVYEYTYNYDYTQRLEVITNNQRSLYVGLGMQF